MELNEKPRPDKSWRRRRSTCKLIKVPGVGSAADGGDMIVIEEGRRSLPHVELNAMNVAAFLGARVMAADMPELMQVHALRCARRAYDGLEKFSAKQIARDIKKEFDQVYGSTWHCIVGTSYGSFVTHVSGCFLYFSVDKILVMLFKTRVPVVLF